MPQKILVVDDERHIVKLIYVHLERAGYEIVTAFNGKEAREQVEAENPALVVLDSMMPSMDGYEVLQNLRENPTTRALPVIMLIARAADMDIFKGRLPDGTGYYMSKPFNPVELVSVVKQIFAAQDEIEP